MNAWAFGATVLWALIIGFWLTVNHMIDRLFDNRDRVAIERHRPHPRGRILDAQHPHGPRSWGNETGGGVLRPAPNDRRAHDVTGLADPPRW